MEHPVLTHVRDHIWLWIAGVAALGVLLAVLGQSTLAAFLFMVDGILLMLKSQGTDILALVTEDPLAGNEDASVSGPETATAHVKEPRQ